MSGRRGVAALLAAVLMSVLTLTATVQGSPIRRSADGVDSYGVTPSAEPSGDPGLVVTPESFSFPDAIVDDAVGYAISVENPGAEVTITSILAGGTNAGDVTIESETCTAGPLSMDELCDIYIIYEALAGGSRSAEVRITVATIGTEIVPISADASYPDSQVSFPTERQAGPAYTWNGGNAFARTVQSGTQRLHLAYATDRIGGEWATNAGPKVGVYYIRSSTGTSASWSTGKRLNPKDQHAAVLGLAAAGSKVYAIWISQTKWINYNPDAARVLYVRVNKKHGVKDEWRSTKALTSSSGRVDYPVIAATGTDAHIAYTNGNSGNVYVASSRDTGVNWAKTNVGGTTIELSDGMSGFPAIAANGSNVTVCWLSDVFGTVKCRVSTDRGVTWGAATTVGSESTGYMSVAVRDTRVAVAWATPDAVVLAQRNSGTWAEPQVVPTDALGDIGQEVVDRYAPLVMLQEENRVALGWAAEITFSTVSWWAESSDGGMLWHEANLIAEHLRNDWQSAVWPSAGLRYVVWNAWNENSGEYDLYLSRGDGTTGGGGPVAVATPWVAGDRAVTVQNRSRFGMPGE